MKKTKYNLFGDSFTHLTGGNKGYSTHGKHSNYIEWVFDGSGVGNFYVDNFIDQAFTEESNLPKYAWIGEPYQFQAKLYEDIKNNPNKYLDTFEMIFTYEQEFLNINSKFKHFCTGGFWIKEPKIYDKSKIISMISSNKKMCEGHIHRLEWVNKIGDQVDLYGRGFNEIELKEDGLCDYMFSVAIENARYDNFFTEKILDCFATGTIPVYYGCPNIDEYFNRDGIINLSEEFEVSDEIYYSKMDAIKDNFERVKQWENAEDYIWINYLNKQ